MRTSSVAERGQGLVEYALILVLVAVVVIAVLALLGPTLGNVFCRVAGALDPSRANCEPEAGVSVALVPPGATTTTTTEPDDNLLDIEDDNPDDYVTVAEVTSPPSRRYDNGTFTVIIGLGKVQSQGRCRVRMEVRFSGQQVPPATYVFINDKRYTVNSVTYVRRVGRQPCIGTVVVHSNQVRVASESYRFAP
jgi:pilus assembly protein Flp/PilA